MNEQRIKRLSKFLSLVLRHQPQTVGIELDAAGWVPVESLLDALHRNQNEISLEQLQEVVETNDKQRFEFCPDQQKIRARQGHSLKVSLGYEPTEPPEFLLHGTPVQFVDSIRESGLVKQKRHHVHLHESQNTAVDAGGRRGRPVLLRIRALEMHKIGFEFFVTENGVWLTDHVPAEFIQFPD